MDGDARRQQRKRDPAGPDAEFKGRALSDARRQKRDRRRWIQAAGADVVIIDVGPVTAVRRRIRQEIRNSRLRGD
jgi:hypothetical protein